MLPGGEFLSVSHVGPIEEVGPAFATIEEALQERGITPTGPSRLIGYDGPDATPAERTSEVLVPIG